jgi:D-tyrosyl-tRNA(Tyr) deacylase
MLGLLQRVSQASVRVDGSVVGQIGPGLLVLLAVEPGDGPAEAERMLERLVGYRVFPDRAGRMNLSLQDTEGELLLVPQFTLAADTRKGMRPSFTTAASPEQGRELFDYSVQSARRLLGERLATGRFGSEMQVDLRNEGPVTFLLRVPPPSAGA